ncbi:N-acetylmuramoyl-L-alanine amidase [Corynebacterium mastitidis]|uniref:N-acetylmuramoyl-L-alanine amidase n=1 Tax=Corynebacterium mastitidis TaxID=161890 RepID=A0A2N0X608_9CORY|nr:peptidoglycan recognition family protein [Corynebacterium mastitidis]MCH6196886.1 N-acetylmuramoyl-L-alanine amidase [Corynebacterium mastitidis]PKF68139.1 N-acetylmuramoyl-L-alanine amidase [Corynebacterium mastitidis]
MKDWNKLEPDKIRIMNRNFSPGRGGKKITHIVRHHNAGVRLTTEDCWDLWQDREASAHYQVEIDGTIGRLVADGDTAWHANNQAVNQSSIGIEHANTGGGAEDWPISESTIEEGAHLAAALCVYYKLGRPVFGKNIRDHREVSETSCPYHLASGGRYHEKWMQRAVYWYDRMTASGSQHVGGAVLSGVSAAALNDLKIAARGSRDDVRDNRIQLRGPNDQGWKLNDLIVYAGNRDSRMGKGTLVELLAIFSIERRALISEVKAVRDEISQAIGN